MILLPQMSQAASCAIKIASQNLQYFKMHDIDNSELTTLHDYLSSLFDGLPSLKDGLPSVCLSYGRKLMQLTDQSTFKYRQQHFLDRKIVEQDMSHLYRSITGEQAQQLSYDQMMRVVSEKMQADRKSIWAKVSLLESRLTPSQTHNDRLLDETTPKGKSRIKSKVVSSAKEALQIKNYLDGVQNRLRDIFQSCARSFQTNKIPLGNMNPEILRYQRTIDENSSGRLPDIVKSGCQILGTNLERLSKVMEIQLNSFQGKLKKQGHAQAKLALYQSEAQRVQDLFSYSLSRILQNLSTVKSHISETSSQLIPNFNNIEELTRKLYDLYPSQSHLSQLAVSIGEPNRRHWGVQTNLGKTNPEKKASSDIWRLQSKINECLERYQKITKSKKSFDLREAERWIAAMKELLTVKGTPSVAEMAEQQQFKRLIDIHQQHEKSAADNHSKVIKKLEKKIAEQEEQLKQNSKEISKAKEEMQQQKKQLQRKLQSQREDYRKLAAQKSLLDKNVTEMIHQIEQMRSAVKKQVDSDGQIKSSLEQKLENSRSDLSQANKQIQSLAQQLKTQKIHMNEERVIYREKIEFIERQLEEERELTAGLRIELQSSLEESSKQKQHLEQMSKVYKQKIKEVEEMIQNIKMLQSLKRSQEATLNEQDQIIASTNSRLEQLSQQNKEFTLLCGELQKQRDFLKGEVEHWREEGRLTDSDLKTLREEVDKVSQAYLEAEENLESTKKELINCSEERQRLFRDKLKMGRICEEQQGTIQTLKAKLQAQSLAERDTKEEYYRQCQESSFNKKQYEETKREAARLRRELAEEREQRTKLEKEQRDLRQEMQNKRETEGAEHGRRRMEIESLKIDLRKKSEQLEKQREHYEERIGLLSQKITEMQELRGQKQILSKLLQPHQTN